MAALLRHPWPGNVRELKNVVERAVYRAEGRMVTEVVFDPFGSDPRATAHRPLPTPPDHAAGNEPRLADLGLPLPEALREVEASYLRTALERSRHNQKRAAELLGLTYHQFRGLFRRLRDTL